MNLNLDFCALWVSLRSAVYSRRWGALLRSAALDEVSDTLLFLAEKLARLGKPLPDATFSGV